MGILLPKRKEKLQWDYSASCMQTQRTEKICASDAYLLLPNREPIFVTSYDGYGHFGSSDVYEVAFDLNRNLLDERFLDECKCIPRNFDRRIIHWALEWKNDQEITNLIKQ
ncbi:MAG: hypothetical protein GX777_09835 [Fastidiosipila sp.]|nr:hypothetical protein [Fastidiosipila sp.]